MFLAVEILFRAHGIIISYFDDITLSVSHQRLSCCCYACMYYETATSFFDTIHSPTMRVCVCITLRKKRFMIVYPKGFYCAGEGLVVAVAAIDAVLRRGDRKIPT